MAVKQQTVKDKLLAKAATGTLTPTEALNVQGALWVYTAESALLKRIPYSEALSELDQALAGFDAAWKKVKGAVRAKSGLIRLISKLRKEQERAALEARTEFSLLVGGGVAHSAVIVSMIHCEVVRFNGKAFEVRAAGDTSDQTIWVPARGMKPVKDSEGAYELDEWVYHGMSRFQLNWLERHATYSGWSNAG